MIQIFDVLLSYQYIYTPLTWIHYLSTGYKIYLTIFLLIIIPYQKSYYILVTIVIYSIAFFCMSLPKKYYLYIPKIFIYILAYLIFYQFSSVKNKLTKQDTLKINFNLIKHNFYIIVPKFTMRIILITVANLISLKILLYTTMYENIALFLLQLIGTKDGMLKEILFIATLSYQFLDQISRYLHRSWISIKIRHHTSLNIKHFINYYFIYSFIIFITNQIYRISSIFHIKKIYLNNFRIYDFDYMNINIMYNKNS